MGKNEFSFEDWGKLVSHAKNLGLNVVISPFSLKAVNLIDDLGVKSLKLVPEKS